MDSQYPIQWLKYSKLTYSLLLDISAIFHFFEIMKFINLIGVLFFFFPLFRCESGYTGQHCEKTDFSILYVVPSRQKLTHVLIAAIIGAVQIAIIVAIVMCITR